MISPYLSKQAKNIKGYVRGILFLAITGCLALPLGAQTRTLEDIKAEAKAQVRRELGLDSKASGKTTREDAVKNREDVPGIPVPGENRKEDVLKIAAAGAAVLILVLGILFWKPVKKKNEKNAPGEGPEDLPAKLSGLEEEKTHTAMPEKTSPPADEGETAIDIYEKIEKLQQLREKEAITEEEFSMKKKELLDRI